MRRLGLSSFAAGLIVAALFSITMAAPASGNSPLRDARQTAKKLPPFDLGVDDSAFTASQAATLAIARTLDIHARYVRVTIAWNAVAPGGAAKPAAFNARNPGDPNYRWATYDAAIERLSAAGLTVYVTLLGAPKWAQQGVPPADTYAGNGAWQPSATDFGDFAHAAAVRYGGGFTNPLTGGVLPRVDIWQAWNEPNLPMYLAPTSPQLYRSLLNAFHDEIKAVDPHATIVTAGLAPVKSSQPAAFPKQFARSLLCIRPRGGWYAADRSCQKAHFDIFSVHPYSLRAKPAQRAAIDGNMFVADVADIHQMLRAARSLKTVQPAGRKGFWSTEFAWFTRPPNMETGDPQKLAARRTNAALYSLWRAGITHVTWFAISDNSPAIVAGGGFYGTNERAKPTRAALRFPFYAAASRHRAYVWGSAPFDAERTVRIQQRRRGGWRTVARLRPRSDGLFSVKLKLRRTGGSYRARQANRVSIAMPASGQGVGPF